MTYDLAVFYLARHAEGIGAFTRFANSYKRNMPGIPHQLHIIYKGFENQHDLADAREVFSGIDTGEIYIADDHFDIGAYLHAAGQVDSRYVCFMNTHTEILSEGWLHHLRKAMDNPKVGMAGAHGSFESLYSSLAVTSKAVWLASLGEVASDPKLSDYYRFAVSVHAPRALKQEQSETDHKRSWMDLIQKQSWIDLIQKQPWIKLIQKPTWSDLTQKQSWKELFGPPKSPEMEERWAEFWGEKVAPGGAFDFLVDFPRFPNPHIRSNCFIIERDTLLSAFPSIEPTKKASYGFESGPNSLTARIRRSGRYTAVVGRNGVIYDQARWPRSKTFRLGNQNNMLVADNQTRTFDLLSKHERATYVMMTWGDSLLWPPRGYPLGFTFKMRS